MLKTNSPEVVGASDKWRILTVTSSLKPQEQTVNTSYEHKQQTTVLFLPILWLHWLPSGVRSRKFNLITKDVGETKKKENKGRESEGVGLDVERQRGVFGCWKEGCDI